MTDVRDERRCLRRLGNLAEFNLPSYGVLDLRAGSEPFGGHWRAAIWGRNVMDKFDLTGVSHFVDVVERSTGMPATYGITVSYRN